MLIIHKYQLVSRFLATNYRGDVYCYDLTISAREEASGSVVTSDSLSTNSPACPQNRSHVCKLASP